MLVNNVVHAPEVRANARLTARLKIGSTLFPSPGNNNPFKYNFAGPWRSACPSAVASAAQ